MNVPCYRINNPTVINETLDGESVMINLETGFYYSLDPVGTMIWESLQRPITPGDIITYLQDHYPNSASVIETDITNLIDELLNEKLIVPFAAATMKTTDESSQLFEQVCETLPSKYSKPTLNKFGDMQDLLLLDPIHEVDEDGWPHSK